MNRCVTTGGTKIFLLINAIRHFESEVISIFFRPYFYHVDVDSQSTELPTG